MLVLAVGGISLDACSHSPAAKKPVSTEPQVVLSVHGGVEQTVTVELARTEDERTRGLMFRQALASGRGMLFLWKHPEPIKFWMKNTYIPLDMIFLDGERRVIYVEENAEPLTLTPRGPDVDTQYVLEVPGRWARAHGVEPGVVARFVNVD
jgi:uncharacterized protein